MSVRHGMAVLVVSAIAACGLQGYDGASVRDDGGLRLRDAAGEIDAVVSACPDDPCSCNTDGDEWVDCDETCIGDPNKREPGVCGCGVPDVDVDPADGWLDCAVMSDFFAQQPSIDAAFGWKVYNHFSPAACVAGKGDNIRIYVDTSIGGTTAPFGAWSSVDDVPTDATINEIEIHYYEGRGGVGPGTGRFRADLGGQTTLGPDDVWSPTWSKKEEEVERPGGGPWTRADLAGLQIRWVADGNGTDGIDARIDQMWLRVNWYPPN